MAEPRPATTVLLVRDGAEGLEVAMIRRSRHTGFMPMVRVYPGGRVDIKDACPAWQAAWTPQHGLSLACVVAGLRETFEEVGLLLARGAVPEAALAERDAYRRDEPPLSELYARFGLEPAFDDLSLFARWVTPEAERKRYDTWFLLARAPIGQPLRPHPAEASEGGWFQPRQLLEEAASLPEFLAPPTLYTLEELAGVPDVEAAFRLARGRTPPVCRPVLDYEDANLRILLPGDAEHPDPVPAYPNRPTRIYYGAGRFLEGLRETMAGEPICLDAGASTTRRLLQAPVPETTRQGLLEGGLRLRGLVKEDAPGLPLISVLTVVRNSETTLEQTLRSVFDQDYPNVECLVVDGASSDGTLDIVRRSQGQIDYWLSEPDDGIADAMNKAIGLARGTLIQLLNADDFLEPGALTAVARAYCRDATPCVVYGHYTMLESGLGTRKPLRSSLDAHRGMSICHQAMFVHRQVYQQLGRFETSLAIAFDYAWFLRALHGGIRFECVERSLVTYRDVGLSSNRLWRCAVEADRIHRRYYSDRRLRAEYLLRTGKHLLVAGLKQQMYARLGDTVTNAVRRAYRQLKGVLAGQERL